MGMRSDRIRAAQRKQERSGTWAALLVLAVVAVPITLWTGFVVKTLWNWFVPLALPGTPRLAVGTAIGLSLVIGMFTQTSEPKDSEGPLDFAVRKVIDVLVEGGIALLFGLIIHAVIA